MRRREVQAAVAPVLRAQPLAFLQINFCNGGLKYLMNPPTPDQAALPPLVGITSSPRFHVSGFQAGALMGPIVAVQVGIGEQILIPALVVLVPDTPVSLLLMSAVDRSCHLLALTTPVYAVVLDAGSTGSRVLGFTFFGLYNR